MRPAALAVVVWLAAAPAAAAACPGAELAPSPDAAPAVRSAIVCLLNGERDALGLSPLARHGRLERGAQAHSADMVARRYLAHAHPQGPGVLERIRGTGYFARARGGVYGENVGVAAEGRATAAELVRAWMASPVHRDTLAYRGFRDVGVGIAFAPADPAFYAGWPSVVFTTDFARRDTRRCRRARRAASPRRWCRRA